MSSSQSRRISKNKGLPKLLLINNRALFLIKANNKIFTKSNIKTNSFTFSFNIKSNRLDNALHNLWRLCFTKLKHLTHFSDGKLLSLLWFKIFAIKKLLKSAFLLKQIWRYKLAGLTVTNCAAQHINICNEAIEVSFAPHKIYKRTNWPEESIYVLRSHG